MAYVTPLPNTFPPVLIAFSKPAYATWTSTGRTLALNVTETDYPYYGDAAVYAQTNVDVTGAGSGCSDL